MQYLIILILWIIWATSTQAASVQLPGGSGTTLPSSTITTSETSKLKVCGTGSHTDECWHIYVHSNGNPIIRCVTNGTEGDCDTSVKIDSGNAWILQDSDEATILRVEPGASGALNQFTFGSGYYPYKSVWFDAAAISTDGTQCAAPAEVTLNSGPKTFTIICTDNDSSTMYGKLKMPAEYTGGAVYFTHVYLQTAADTNVLNGDIAAQCRGNGVAVNSTWGTEIAIDDAAVTGSNKNDFTTTASGVTPNGTCTGAPMLYWRYQLDATGTTTAVATLHHLGFMMEYPVLSWSSR